jgi:glycosyltransferase involved in cell wall biosynthesis
LNGKPDSRSFFLVLPCYDEGRRLPEFLPGLCAAVAHSGLSVTVGIADDGSGNDHRNQYRQLIEALTPRFAFIRPTLEREPNQGKGAVIYAAWSADETSDFLCFVDADGAVAPDEAVRLLRMVAEDPEADRTLYAASRIPDGSTRVQRRALRNSVGLIFRRLRKGLFSLPVEDTQCGFKIVPAPFFREREELFTEAGFAFDIELLSRARNAGLNIREVPVTWQDKKGGHMSFMSSLTLLVDLVKLKARLKREDEGAVGH